MKLNTPYTSKKHAYLILIEKRGNNTYYGFKYITENDSFYLKRLLIRDESLFKEVDIPSVYTREMIKQIFDGYLNIEGLDA